MKRIIAIAAVPLLLGGCLPLPITIASTAISGISYLTTGKSSTDHVLSGAIDQDCALTRPIIGDPVCKEIDPNSPAATERVIVVAHPGDRDDGAFTLNSNPLLHRGAMKLDELPRGPAQIAVVLPFVSPPHEPIQTPGLLAEDTAAAPIPEARPITVSAPANPWTPPEPVARLDVASAAPVIETSASEAGEAGRYVVIGSLRDAGRAEVLRARYAKFAPEIRKVDIDGLEWNRVVVGPLAPDQALEMRADLGKIDGKQPWIVRLKAKAELIAMR